MNRTLKELEADLKTFAQSLVAGITDKPTVLLSKLGDKPIKYRIGIAVTGHPDETIKALITRDALQAAQLGVWPENVVMACNPKSIATAADGRTVIVDVSLYGITIDLPRNLTPG